MALLRSILGRTSLPNEQVPKEELRVDACNVSVEQGAPSGYQNVA